MQCSPGVAKSHLKADDIIVSVASLSLPLFKFNIVLLLVLMSIPN